MLWATVVESCLRTRHSFLFMLLFLSELNEATAALFTRCVVQNRLLLFLAKGLPGSVI